LLRKVRGVDPRSRGEDQRGNADIALLVGRSPLTRGRQPAHPVDLVLVGSIPAHAGKTSRGATARAAARVDPRSRGEDQTAGRTPRSRQGRSPLTRGRRFVSRAANAVGRSIPAHAGKTRIATSRPYRRGVDPRSRGEDIVVRILTWPSRGRSPLTRGRPFACAHPDLADGSIPAHAGKTYLIPIISSDQEVDPRSRGEDHFDWVMPERPSGRSPLTRGRRELVAAAALVLGSIPAHAGKTRW